ncbi:MAG: 2-oxo acid dehydrogenase subunit E2 [Sphingomonadales bacterium]|nr:2-oxo acid dehydrogenase subunit E2 [Sphingomonadales bacterium]
MPNFDLVMPKMGESIMEATILKWLKKQGDSISLDEAVLEIATDKVDSEVPSPVAGTLKEVLFAEGDVVQVGSILARIDTSGSAVKSVSSDANEISQTSPAVSSSTVVEVPSTVAADTLPVGTARLTEAINPVGQNQRGGGRFYSPLVLSIASSEGVGMAELEQIQGSGAEGRVTKKDILAYVGRRSSGKTEHKSSAQASSPSQASSALDNAISTGTRSAQSAIASKDALQHPASAVPMAEADTEIIEMDRMRRMIADNMVASKRISAHVTSFVEADVTRIVQWRDQIKKSFEERYGEKLTFTPLFIEAAVRAIQDFPMINVSVDGHHLIRKKHIHIGMAAALPNGNLIVPVIHNADQYNLAGLAKKVNDLANRARLGKLKPEEIQGATYTLSNVGTFGNVMGTPIIPQPQVAIMALGAIRKKPAVIETETGDLIGIRQMMFLSHSYDHRVVDGALGGMFVRRMADYLENWDIGREI